mgnify:CR=1 FL=1
MLRIWVVVIAVSLFPLIAQAQEETIEQHAEFQTGGEGQVVVTVSIGKDSAGVRISILHLKKEHEDEQQKGEPVLSDSRETFSHRRHSRGRAK